MLRTRSKSRMERTCWWTTHVLTKLWERSDDILKLDKQCLDQLTRCEVKTLQVKFGASRASKRASVEGADEESRAAKGSLFARVSSFFAPSIRVRLLAVYEVTVRTFIENPEVFTNYGLENRFVHQLQTMKVSCASLRENHAKQNYH